MPTLDVRAVRTSDSHLIWRISLVMTTIAAIESADAITTSVVIGHVATRRVFAQDAFRPFCLAHSSPAFLFRA